jgi:transposase
VVPDSKAFHEAKSLRIPENISLLFLPSYSPELNPAEKIRAIYKRIFTNPLFKSLKQIGVFIENSIKALLPEQIIKICNYDYVYSSANNLFLTRNCHLNLLKQNVAFIT